MEPIITVTLSEFHELKTIAQMALATASIAVVGLLGSIMINIRNCYLLKKIREGQLIYFRRVDRLLINQTRFKVGLENAEKGLSELKNIARREVLPVLSDLKNYTKIVESRQQGNHSKANANNAVHINTPPTPADMDHLLLRQQSRVQLENRLIELEEIVSALLNENERNSRRAG